MLGDDNKGSGVCVYEYREDGLCVGVSGLTVVHGYAAGAVSAIDDQKLQKCSGKRAAFGNMALAVNMVWDGPVRYRPAFAFSIVRLRASAPDSSANNTVF